MTRLSTKLMITLAVAGGIVKYSLMPPTPFKSALSPRTCSSLPPTSQALVTPAARNSGRNSRSTNVAWTCVSIRPARTVCRFRSIASAPGAAGVAPLSTAVIRYPSMAKDTPALSWSAMLSINRTFLKRMLRAMSVLLAHGRAALAVFARFQVRGDESRVLHFFNSARHTSNVG